MAHVIDGERQGKEQVVAYDDPRNLHSETGLRDRVKQDTRNCHQHTRDGNPGACLALTGARLVDDPAHDDVGEGVEYLGQQRHQGQEQPAHAQHVRVELGQVGARHGIVNHVDEAWTGEVAEPHLALLGIGGLDPGIKRLGGKDSL